MSSVASSVESEASTPSDIPVDHPAPPQPQQVPVVGLHAARATSSSAHPSVSIAAAGGAAFTPATVTSSTAGPAVPAEPIGGQSSSAAAAAATSGSGGAKAGTKRVGSLPPLDRSGRNLSEKKIRRLEKNRLSARECRRKKKEAAQYLEREINLLEAENLRLRLQLQVGEEAEASSWKEQGKLTEGLDTLLKSGASESEVYASIEEFKEKFADYGRDRRSAMEFHLRQVERLLMPTTTTSVAMRALQGGADIGGTGHGTMKLSGRPSAGNSANVEGAEKPGTGTTDTSSTTSAASITIEATNDLKMPAGGKVVTTDTKELSQEVEAFVEVPSSADTDLSSTASSVEDSPVSAPQEDPPSLEPKSMFHYLVKYLGVTPEQAVALKDSRLIARELDSALTESLSVLEELRLRLTQAGSDLEAEMDSVRAILTPTQAAKFLVWVSNNSACMHMLNELWNKELPDPPVQS